MCDRKHYFFHSTRVTCTIRNMFKNLKTINNFRSEGNLRLTASTLTLWDWGIPKVRGYRKPSILGISGIAKFETDRRISKFFNLIYQIKVLESLDERKTHKFTKIPDHSSKLKTADVKITEICKYYLISVKFILNFKLLTLKEKRSRLQTLTL